MCWNCDVAASSVIVAEVAKMRRPDPRALARFLEPHYTPLSRVAWGTVCDAIADMEEGCKTVEEMCGFASSAILCHAMLRDVASC
jgi:hypothetical protein